MSKTARRLLFLFFSLFFLVAAPTIVLYTAGYRYNPRSGLILQTGVLSIQSMPRNATIFVNGNDIGKTTPSILKRLVPGTYMLELRRKDYLSWQGEVTVKSGATTFLQNILLLRDTEPQKKLDLSASIFTPGNSQSVLYATADKDWLEIHLLNIQNSGDKVLLRLPSHTASVQKMTWSANGENAFVLLSNGELSVFEENGQAIDLSQVKSEKITEAKWHPSDDHILYTLDVVGKKEWRFDANGVTAIELAEESIALTNGHALNFIDNGTETELREITPDGSRLIALLPRGKYTAFKQDNSFLLLAKEGGNLMLIHTGTTEPLLLSTNAHLYDWQASHDLLAYSDGNEVNVYRPANHQVTFLTRIGEEIRHITWHPTTQYVFIATEKRVEALELYKSAKDRQRITLAEMDEIRDMWMSTNGKTLYLYGKKDGEEGIFSQTLTR